MGLLVILMIMNICWDWHDNDGSTEEDKSWFYVFPIETSLTSNHCVYLDFHSKKN